MLLRSSRFATNRKTSLARRLRVEPLEDRRMLVAYTVDSLGDADDGDPNNGSTTLREAVNLANANAGLDDIDFNFPVGSTITLTSTQLNITDSVNIIGPGADLLTIDASGADPTPNDNEGNGIRIFNVFKSGEVIDVAIRG